MTIDFDDFGCNHIISDQCQSHDCRDKLDSLHYANPNFKVTLFTIPGEMTAELLQWCKANNSWVELAVHGFYHTDNYECSSMDYFEIQNKMDLFKPMLDEFFVKGFKAPGWQISDMWYNWLVDNDYWIADQNYNDSRRPSELPSYVNHSGMFRTRSGDVNAWHGHTWDCMGNGIYETYDHVEELVKNANDFQFVSEVV